jgi:5-methylcytosine-specific restriction enzyme subunit McrC
MKDAEISFESFHQDGRPETKVRLFFVDVANIEGSLRVLKEKLLNRVAVTE